MTIDYRAAAFLARRARVWEGSPAGADKPVDVLDGPRATLARHDEAIEKAESEEWFYERVLRGGRIWMRVDALGDDYTAGADEGAFGGMSPQEISDIVLELWREASDQSD